MIVERHCSFVSFKFWPREKAISIPISPDIKNLKDNVPKGGAYATIILAELKAEDHINANIIPIIIARTSIIFPIVNKCFIEPFWEDKLKGPLKRPFENIFRTYLRVNAIL